MNDEVLVGITAIRNCIRAILSDKVPSKNLPEIRERKVHRVWRIVYGLVAWESLEEDVSLHCWHMYEYEK